MMKWFQKRGEMAAPDEIRQAREAAGWTQEQVADAMGVLPLEVSAWESGAVAIDRYKADLVRWHVRMAEHQARLPRSECYWMRANTARLDRLAQVKPHTARREIAAHTHECAECMRVELLMRHVPAPPEPPAEPGFWGRLEAARRRIARSPAWLRVPLQGTEFAFTFGLLYLAFHAIDWVTGDPFDASLSEFLPLLAGFLWLICLLVRLAPVAERRPYLAGQLLTAGMALPIVLFLELRDPSVQYGFDAWIWAALLSVFIGLLAGRGFSREPDAEDDAPDEEREVVIPQRDTSFRA